MSNSKQISRRRFFALGGSALATAFVGGAFVTSGCPLSNSGVCVGPCAAFYDRNGDGICDRIQVGTPEPQQASCTTPECTTETPTATHSEHTPPQNEPPAPHALGCPFGLVNDPYPGKCGRYVDADGNGICDLSEGEYVEGREDAAPVEDEASQEMAPTALPTATPGATPQPTPSAAQPLPTQPLPTQSPPAQSPPSVACPFGLVNDPYPGQCRRYVDRNGNGICDLSEVAPTDEAGSDTLATPAAPATVQPAPGDESDQPRRGRGRQHE